MAYAIKKDGSGWRLVDSKKELTNGETFSEFKPKDAISQELVIAQKNASIELAKSDTTVIRCIEKGSAVPEEWIAYRDALRQILSCKNDDDLKAMPSKPKYPAGS